MLVENPVVITEKELMKLARQARGRITTIYLHWTAGRYGQVYDDYHLNIDQDGTVYVLAEHYESGLSVEKHAAAIKALANELDWPRGRNGHLTGIIDCAGLQRTLAAEKNVVELFYEQGIDLSPTTQAEKERWSGIQRVKQYLQLREADDKDAWPKGKPRLFVFRNNANMIKEFKSYRWKPDSDSDVIKEGDDAMDDLRYYIARRPEAYHHDVPMTDVMRHKEEAVRRATANRAASGRKRRFW